MGDPWAVGGTGRWNGGGQRRRGEEVNLLWRLCGVAASCSARRQGAADDGKRPLRRLRVAVAKLKRGDLGGLANYCFRFCGFNGYDGASEGPFSLFEGSWRALGSVFACFCLQFHVKLPILASACVLTSQLSLKSCPNLPSKAIFHRFRDPPNLDFCNTLQGFWRFFNVSANLFKTVSQAPKSPPN